MFIQIILISLIVSFIVDYSGIIPKLSKLYYSLMFKNVKWDGELLPLVGCSLCTGFWCTLIYMLIKDQSIINSLGISCLVGYSEQFITESLYIIRELIIKLLNKIK